MILETVIAVLACTRIGAIHSTVVSLNSDPRETFYKLEIYDVTVGKYDAKIKKFRFVLRKLWRFQFRNLVKLATLLFWDFPLIGRSFRKTD